MVNTTGTRNEWRYNARIVVSNEKPSNPFDEAKDENGVTIHYEEVDEHLVQSKKILQQLLLQYPDIPVIKDLNHDMQQITSELNQGRLQSDIRKVLMVCLLFCLPPWSQYERFVATNN